jgi:uncharacterized cupredoxin-like copper-binding protein
MMPHLSDTRRRWTPAASVLAAVAAAAMFVSGFAPTSAQDEMQAHPAHIHEGTCDQLGDVVFPLTNVSEMGMMGGTPEADAPPMEMSEPMGAETAFGVETSFTLLDAPLDEIVEGGHAINVHQSKENIEEYIACGDIGGRIETGPGMEEGGTLVVGLGELNDSGYAGIAVLEGRGDQTEVVIYLAEGLSGETGMADDEEEATPAAAAGEVVAVELDEFEVRMPSELAAGPTTFRVTNVGSAEHNFEVEGQGIEEEFEENLRPGETKEMTLDLQPGTYEVYCPVGNHEDLGMRLELTVTK